MFDTLVNIALGGIGIIIVWAVIGLFLDDFKSPPRRDD